jgi:hypothetical protein
MSINMISMERPKPATVESKAAQPIEADECYEKYPWGLRVTLRQEELAKLGIDVTELAVGENLSGTVKLLVTEISDNQRLRDSGETSSDQRLELQITSMSIQNDQDFAEAFKEAVNE